MPASCTRFDGCIEGVNQIGQGAKLKRKQIEAWTILARFAHSHGKPKRNRDTWWTDCWMRDAACHFKNVMLLMHRISHAVTSLLASHFVHSWFFFYFWLSRNAECNPFCVDNPPFGENAPCFYFVLQEWAKCVLLMNANNLSREEDNNPWMRKNLSSLRPAIAAALRFEQYRTVCSVEKRGQTSATDTVLRKIISWVDDPIHFIHMTWTWESFLCLQFYM